MDDQVANREDCEDCPPKVAQQIHINSPLAKRALTVFGVAFATLLIPAIIPLSMLWAAIIVASSVLTLFGSGAVFVVALAYRDLKANEWRFCLRDLFAVITAIAVVLGMLVSLLRSQD